MAGVGEGERCRTGPSTSPTVARTVTGGTYVVYEKRFLTVFVGGPTPVSSLGTAKLEGNEFGPLRNVSVDVLLFELTKGR